MHRPSKPRRPVGTLDGPSRTITVEPIQVPAKQPETPSVTPEPSEPAPERDPEREPVPAR
jgi:hypothetical protein